MIEKNAKILALIEKGFFSFGLVDFFLNFEMADCRASSLEDIYLCISHLNKKNEGGILKFKLGVMR